ncbi:protein SLX4IP isoform X1 [Acipenser oxyrinchus oxyrinchus]|uniref:Protein SLX4IP isoform X1 n=1 Tax=Acipenser oxyrinchus oxyrinchus TaxID=40147 RepID=A0AAD8GA08_ACIOX|nr:protein SLX4IP isoform X1 [Acipenser oxyrinchus oxyrinchus]
MVARVLRLRLLLSITEEMSPSKFVVKCGNFVVLVDLHILPQGSSKDTSWFAEQQKEEVSILLREAVDLRVKQHLEARNQHVQPKPHKELTQANPLCIKGEHFRLAAYFMKRHVNLRCIVKEQYQELRVFPDKFVVCVSRQEEGPKHRTNEKSTVEKQPFTNRSEYFADPCESEDKDKLNISNITQKKSSLKKIVKKAKGDNASKPDEFAIMKTRTGKDMDVFHATSEPRRIVPDTSEGGTSDSENRVQSSVLVPLSELGNYIDKREPAGVSSQKQPYSMELLNIGPLSGFPSLSCESALPQPKQSLGKSRIQNKRRRHYSQEDGHNAKKVFIGENPATPSEVIIKTDSAESLTQTSMKKSPLGFKSCSKQVLAETTLDEDLLTLGKSTLKPPLENNNTEQTNQNKLTTNIQELSVKPVSSHPDISSRPSDRKEGVENVPRKSRLRRLKKS